MFSKIELLKTADRIFGNFLSAVVRSLVPPRRKSQHVKKILFIRPGGIGDAVLLVPALREVKNHFTNADIDVLAEKRNMAVFRMCDEVENIFVYDSFKNPGLLQALKNRYDIAVDTEQWHKLSSVISYLTRAPVRIGFDTNGRCDLFTKAVSYSGNDYEAESFFKLVNELIPRKTQFDPENYFIFTNRVNQNIDSELERLKGNSDAVIGLFYGATVKERKWGAEKYAHLANNFKNINIGVVLFGGKADLPEQFNFLNLLENREKFLNYTGKTSLPETAYILSKTDLFISGDSGLMHLAYGLGVKTLSLFGAGIEEKWAPKGKYSFVINKRLQCSPCTEFGYTPECPYGVKCLSDISVNEVYGKALEILGLRK